MQKALGPTDRKTFRDNYLAVALIGLALFFASPVTAQVDTAQQRQPIKGYGFDWKNGHFLGSAVMPTDTPKLAVTDSGGIAWKGGHWWGWTGYLWLKIDSATAGGGPGGSRNADSIRSKSVDTTGIAIGGGYIYYDMPSGHYKFRGITLSDVLNGLAYTPLSTLDSVHIYSTIAHLNKTIDSMKAVNDARYRLKVDTVVAGGVATNGHLNKVADSLGALITGGGGGTDSGIAVLNGILATRSGTGPTVILQADSSKYATLPRVQKKIDSAAIAAQLINQGGGFRVGKDGTNILKTIQCTGCAIDTAITNILKFTVSQPLFYLLDYAQGHTGDSVTDFAPYFDSAFAHMPQLSYQRGGTLYIPAGTFYLSRPVKIPSYVNVFGVGTAAPITGLGQPYGNGFVGTYGGSVIQTRGSYNAFEFDTAGTGFSRTFSNVIKDMMFTCDSSSNPTAGSALYAQNSVFLLVDNVIITRFYVDVTIKAGFNYTFRHCIFENPVFAAMDIGNNIEVDAGDFLLDDCLFSTNGQIGATHPTGIIYRGGGGFKGSNLKFNGAFPSGTPNTRFAYDIYANITQGQTSDFLLSNSSFENYDTTGIYINTTNNFANVIITGLQTAGGGSVGPVLDINNVNNVFVGNFAFGNNGTAVTAPMINLNGLGDVTIGMGSQNNNYTASPLIAVTGCTRTHIDPMWTGQLVLPNNDITTSSAYYSQHDDIAGQNQNSISLRNTHAAQATTGSEFNIADVNLYSGDGTVRGLLTTSYATTGAAAPFNFSGLALMELTDHPIVFLTGATTTEKMRLFNSGNLVIGSTTDVASSKFTIASTSQGFLPPRMTTTQMNAISSPATGLLIWNSDSLDVCKYTGSAWRVVGILGSGVGSNYQTVQNGGSSITQRANLNFLSPLAATDNSGNNSSDISLPLGNKSTPTLTAGAGAGTGPTITVQGATMSGRLNVVTGSSPTSSAAVVTVTLGGSQAFASTGPLVVLTPANAAAAALAGNASISVDHSGTTQWIITVGSTALAASTTYAWNYFVTGY